MRFLTLSLVTVVPAVSAVCPNCWTTFPPQQSLFVTEHVELLGDARLGPDAQTRFLPTRFNVQGDAIDAKGFPCSQIACPQCHLTVPRACLELPPLFLSIFGAPGSGKSYYLAAMTWQLRATLPERFRLAFGDADPAMNRTLVDYEESLLVNPHADDLIPLGQLIRKTETQGDLYNAVAFGGQNVLYSRPFLFTLRPRDDHPAAAGPAGGARLVCLYDNAGESFQPGADSAAAPVTRHLAHSRALLFVFDPTQDGRFRKAAGISGSAAQLSRQEPILQEAAARVRRHAGLRHSEKHQRPLIVVLSKYDRWSGLLNEDVPMLHGNRKSVSPSLCGKRTVCEAGLKMVRASAPAACPKGDRPPMACRAWQTAIGDAICAAVLAADIFCRLKLASILHPSA